MGVKVVNADEGIALRVGEPKKQLCIALPDCRVIATSEPAKATPVFSKLEE